MNELLYDLTSIAIGLLLYGAVIAACIYGTIVISVALTDTIKAMFGWGKYRTAVEDHNRHLRDTHIAELELLLGINERETK